MVVVELTCIKIWQGATVEARRVDFGQKVEIGLPGKPVFREDEIKPLLRSGFRLLYSWRQLGRNGGTGYKFWDLWGAVHVFGDLDRVYKSPREVEARYQEWQAEMDEAWRLDQAYLAAEAYTDAGSTVRQGGRDAQ
jgi:hypothetical protein